MYVYTYKYHDLFTHSPFDRHLDYFQVFTIMNKVGMNILVPVLLWTYVFIFLGEILRGLLSHRVDIFSKVVMNI